MTWGSNDSDGPRRRGFFRVDRTLTPEQCQRVSNVRRAWYSFASTIFCLLVPVAFVFGGFESTLAIKVAEGLFSFAELMAILYLSAGVIDKADIGRHIGNRFNRHDAEYRPSYEPPPTSQTTINVQPVDNGGPT